MMSANAAASGGILFLPYLSMLSTMFRMRYRDMIVAQYFFYTAKIQNMITDSP